MRFRVHVAPTSAIEYTTTINPRAEIRGHRHVRRGGHDAIGQIGVVSSNLTQQASEAGLRGERLTRRRFKLRGHGDSLRLVPPG